MRFWIGSAAAVLLVSILTGAEQNSSQKPDSKNSSATQTQKKPALTDVMRVSTDASINSAAKEEVKNLPSDQATKEESETDVLEFRPADTDATTSNTIVGVPKGSKKIPLKNIHGTVYGSSDANNAGTHNTGGSVGASSKSGKSYLYLETDKSRTSPSR